MTESDAAGQWAAKLVHRLVTYPRENEHCEFKVGNQNPVSIGEYVSALSNSAAIAGLDHGYLVWGIRDEDHAIVGTDFHPAETKVGNEELGNWLLHNLEPQVDLRFTECVIDGKPVVVLEVPAATHKPIQFKRTEYVRIGSYNKRLIDHAEENRRLWRAFDSRSFETGVAQADVPVEDVLALLDHEAYFRMLSLPIPASRDQVLEVLAADKLISVNALDEWNITNLGAVLFARDMRRFPTVSRKAMRVITYDGDTRQTAIREQSGHFGYANGFTGLVDYVNNRLPANEQVGAALRKDVRMYPELAIRELLANALIHQDFTITGSGPMVEIFANRLEVTNPGKPLVDTRRFVDHPPRSRNEALASLMRRMGVCEERGSGWDRIGFEIELYQLPAPEIRVINENTQVILYGHRPLTTMDRDDRIRAVYLHACLRYVSHEHTTNASIRERFAIPQGSASLASRLISEAVGAGAIAPYDASAGRRFMRYVPYWADTSD